MKQKFFLKSNTNGICTTSTNEQLHFESNSRFVGFEAEVWPSENAAYGVNIMWEGVPPTQWLRNSRFWSLGKFQFGGNGSGFLPKNEGGSSQVPTNWMLTLFQNFTLGKRENKLVSTQEDFFLHHLIIWASNHNAYQMKKWCCRMWRSVVFSENIHGPWRLIPQSCCLSKLPQPEFWVTMKACFSSQISHYGFQLKIYGLSSVSSIIKGTVLFPRRIPPVILNEMKNSLKSASFLVMVQRKQNWCPNAFKSRNWIRLLSASRALSCQSIKIWNKNNYNNKRLRKLSRSTGHRIQRSPFLCTGTKQASKPTQMLFTSRRSELLLFIKALLTHHPENPVKWWWDLLLKGHF